MHCIDEYDVTHKTKRVRGGRGFIFVFYKFRSRKKEISFALQKQLTARGLFATIKVYVRRSQAVDNKEALL